VSKGYPMTSAASAVAAGRRERIIDHTPIQKSPLAPYQKRTSDG
jgi:hypothetical protein